MFVIGWKPVNILTMLNASGQHNRYEQVTPACQPCLLDLPRLEGIMLPGHAAQNKRGRVGDGDVLGVLLLKLRDDVVSPLPGLWPSLRKEGQRPACLCGDAVDLDAGDYLFHER